MLIPILDMENLCANIFVLSTGASSQWLLFSWLILFFRHLQRKSHKLCIVIPNCEFHMDSYVEIAHCYWTQGNCICCYSHLISRSEYLWVCEYDPEIFLFLLMCRFYSNARRVPIHFLFLWYYITLSEHFYCKEYFPASCFSALIIKRFFISTPCIKIHCCVSEVYTGFSSAAFSINCVSEVTGVYANIYWHLPPIWFSVLIRPHPAIWRLVHGMAVVYLVSLTFLLFQVSTVFVQSCSKNVHCY